MSTYAKYPAVTGSGGGGGGNAFTIIQPDTGTSPTATTPTSTLSVTSPDSSVSVAGNSATNTLSLSVAFPVTTAANVGTGAGQLFKALSGTTLQFKRLAAGSNTTITDGASDVTIDVSAPVQSLSNVGSGAGTIYKGLSGTAAQLKTIAAGTGITVTNNTNDITLATTAALNSFTTVVPDAGTSPVASSATDTLTVTSPSGPGSVGRSIEITGDSVAKSLSMRVVNVSPTVNSVNDSTDGQTVRVIAGYKTAGTGIGGSLILEAAGNSSQSSSINNYGTVSISADGIKTVSGATGGRVITYAFDQMQWFFRSFSTSVDMLRVTTSRFLFRAPICLLDATNTENTIDIGKNTSASLERPRNVFIGTWVGVGTGATPTTSTIAEFTSTTGAVLFPRMTSTQRDALTATNGMVLYNSTTDKLQVRAAGAWVDLH